MYTIKADRKTAALYYAWEFGIARAVQRLREFTGTLTFGIGGKNGQFKRKADARAWADRVAQVAAFQQGRLGNRNLVTARIEIVTVGG